MLNKGRFFKQYPILEWPPAYAKKVGPTIKVTAADKKASQDRVTEMNKVKGSIDAGMQQANSLMPHLDEQIQQIQKEYDDALSTLKSRLEDKAKSAK